MGLRDTIFRISPPWLQDAVGARLLYSVGACADALMEKASQAVKAWCPTKGTPTTLSYLGDDREIRRGLFETDDQYAGRLRTAFSDLRYIGTARGVLNQLLGYLSPVAPHIRHVSYSSVWDYYPDGTLVPVKPTHYVALGNWNWDSVLTPVARWYRFWVVIDASSSVTGLSWVAKGAKWGDGSKWGNGRAWGVSTAASVGQSMRAIIAKWKRAGAVCHGVIVSFDPTLFLPSSPAGYPMPDGTFGRWGTVVNGVAVRARPAEARYGEGVA